MKVQVFEGDSSSGLSSRINQWLKTVNGSITIVDIKYSVSITNYGNSNSFRTVHGALIQYN